MKKLIVLLAVALAMALGGAYFYFSGREYVIKIPQQTLQDKLAAKLPLTKTYFLFFHLTFDHSRVSLTEGSNRIAVGMDVVLDITGGNGSRPIGGVVDLSGGVRYDSSSGELFLMEPVIENLALQGLPEKYKARATEIIGKALIEYCKTHPVYTLKKNDARQATARLVLKKVTVENRALIVTLGM
jgi:Protein of unknown function (DUF1439)